MSTAPPTTEAPPADPGRAARLRERLDGLFPPAATAPIGRRAVALAILAVGAGTAVSLARTTGTGPFQSIWEEDARDLLTDALLRPGAFNLVKPYVGYFQVGPRLMAEVTVFFPISWAAAVLSIQAALAAALLALTVYVASGTHFRHPLARLLVSAPTLFAPVAENIVSEIYNRPATVQFFLVYAVFWLMLWVPARPVSRLVLVGVIALSAISTVLVALFIPLALLRVYLRRDRISAALLAFGVTGVGIQLLGLYLGLTNRNFVEPKYEPLWALKSVVVWAVPHSILGWRLTSAVGDIVRAEQLWLILLSWAVIAGALVVALRRLTRPAWLLAAVAAAHGVGLCCMTIMSNGGVTQRYLLPVEMLLFAALTALLLPSDRLRPALAVAPLAVLAALVLTVGAVNYRWENTFRARAPHWGEQVDRAALVCQQPGMREVVIRSGPQPWWSLVTVPCHILKRDNWCQSPYCVQVGALDAPAGPPRRRTPG